MKAYLISTVLSSVLFLAFSCKKYSFNDHKQSDFLPVQKKNSSLIFNYAYTSSAYSGSTGYDLFNSYLEVYDSLQVLATITSGDIGGANNDTIFDSHSVTFGVSEPSSFHVNLDSASVSNTIYAHTSSTVIANAAYALSLTPSSIIINTTTEFFEDVEGETFYLTPYLIVDSIVANQAGHPDGAMTNHRKNIVDVGRLSGYPVRYLGYKIASGKIQSGHRINLTFTADRLASWIDPEQISVVLVITKKDLLGNPVFVNASANY